jgi:YD repeat-containing protein
VRLRALGVRWFERSHNPKVAGSNPGPRYSKARLSLGGRSALVERVSGRPRSQSASPPTPYNPAALKTPGDRLGGPLRTRTASRRRAPSDDKRGLQQLWRVTDDATGNLRQVKRDYFPSGALQKRTGRKVLDPNQSHEYEYTYTYDPNGSLASMHDDKKDRTTTFAYDDADRQTLADEQAFDVNEETRRGKDTKVG